jgi:hypothetical protein
VKKLVSIDYDEYLKYTQTIDKLRGDITHYQTEIQKLKKEIDFLKDSGENILVIVKDRDKPDVHEYKTTEKNVLTDLVAENYRVRDRYDELSRRIDNVENQKQLIILKYKEMEGIYKTQVNKLEEYVDYLENRSFWSRIKNETKNIKRDGILVSYDEPGLLEAGPTKTIYSEDEIKRLEEEASKVKKPRGWHFREEFIDDEGNVYHKGKLQPHLKGTKKQQN